jgi:hypothetical protein
MTSTYQYPIYRANEVNLRLQIMEHLESLYWADQFSMVKDRVEAGEDIVIPENYQMFVADAFTIDGGNLTIEGRLLITDYDA